MAQDPYGPCNCGSGKKFKWCCQPIFVAINRAWEQEAAGQHDAAQRILDEVVKEHEGNPEAPDALVAVVEKLMQKAPASRYPTCAEVLDALRPLAGGSPVPGRRATMAMPRVKLARPEGPRPAAPSPAAAPRELPRPRGAQPLPPRAPSPASKFPSSSHGLKPAIPTPAAPASLPQPIAPSAAQSSPEAPAPASAPASPRLGTIGIVLLAILAGVAAYFISAMLNVGM